MRMTKDLFLLAHGGLLLVLLLIQFQFSQLEISLWVNHLNTKWFDFICLYGTFLGDGWLVFLVCFILYFFEPKLAITVFLSYALSALFTQGLKHFVFAGMNRPLWFIEHQNLIGFHFVEGAEQNYRNSFPSGHSTSAFAFFGGLCLFFQDKRIKFFLFMVAVFTAFTRIYLLQHFLMDTCVGSIIGIGTAYGIYYLLSVKGKLNFLINKSAR